VITCASNKDIGLLEGNVTVGTKGEAMNTSVSHELSIDGKIFKLVFFY